MTNRSIAAFRWLLSMPLTAAAFFGTSSLLAAPQESLIVRPPPPALEEFETDVAPADDRPDGWYNDRGASLVSPGLFGQRCLRIENDKPSRPARISRAFGVDGSKYSALKLSVWVKVSDILPGEHQGEAPGIMIDFLNGDLLDDSRGLVGPFDSVTVGENRWFFVSRVIPVEPTTLDAIMTVGLLGATGRMDIDRMTLELIPRDMPSTTELVPNGDFALGDIKPDSWSIEGPTRRIADPQSGKLALELGRGRGRALAGLGRRVDDLKTLQVTVKTHSHGLRSTGGAALSLYFTDDRGGSILDRASQGFLRFVGSTATGERTALVKVPGGARGAVLQFEKTDDAGLLTVESVSVTDADGAERSRWTPRSIPLAEGSDAWPVFEPIRSIEPGSVLDTAGYGLTEPKPPLKVVKGKLTDADGKAVRLWGVSLLPTAAFPEEPRAAVIAERLHRLGVNVVRFGDLDLAYGPGISLIDDARDDTARLDAESWLRMSRFQAELAKRGIFYSLELHSARRFREGDGVADARRLPAGGGPAAVFDPELTERIDALSRTILTTPRPEGLPKLADDPRLAWVTMSGEISLMDADGPAAPFTDRQTEILRKLQAQAKSGNVTRFRRDLEKSRYDAWAKGLRSTGLDAPLASLSHWKRDAEFAEVFSGPELGVVEDRYYWPYAPWTQPGYRSAVYDAARSLAVVADSKRRPDQAYILAHWCAQSQGAWSLPTEAADVLLGAFTAYRADFDGLLRHGLAVHPEDWGHAATGTGGSRDIFNIPESLSGMPQMLEMMPHVASILRRERVPVAQDPSPKATSKKAAAKKALPLPPSLPGWNPSEGILRLETPHTVGLAGRIGGAPSERGDFGEFQLEFDDDFGVIVVSSATPEPLSQSTRLLVTILGRATPTGLRYKDAWQKEVADPGRAPLRLEPVTGRFLWKGSSPIHSYPVDSSGRRADEVVAKKVGDSAVVELDLASNGPHWEIVVDR